MHLRGVLAHDRDLRPGLDERAWYERILPEHGCTHGEHGVVGRERLTDPYPVGRQVARELSVVLREARTRAERLLPDRAGQPLGESDEGDPGIWIVGSGTHHEHGAFRAGEEACELRDGGLVRCLRPDDAAGRSTLARIGRLRGPVVHRHDHDGRPSACRRLVVGAGDRAWHVLGAHGLIDPDRVVAGETLQPAREERLRGEVTAVLLAHHDDEWRPVDACGRKRADRVAEPGGRVQDRECRLAAPDCPPCRHADDRALVEAEHEVEIWREVGEEGDLRRSGVREERGEPVLAEDVEGGFANRLDTHGWEHICK